MHLYCNYFEHTTITHICDHLKQLIKFNYLQYKNKKRQSLWIFFCAIEFYLLLLFSECLIFAMTYYIIHMIEGSVTCINTYYARVHTRMHTFDWHTRPQTHQWTHTCMHAQTNTYACTYAHIHTRATTQTHAHACRREDIYTHTVTNLLARRYVRKLANMHTYA